MVISDNLYFNIAQRPQVRLVAHYVKLFVNKQAWSVLQPLSTLTRGKKGDQEDFFMALNLQKGKKL